MPAVIEAFGLHKTYLENRIHAVDGVNFHLDTGEVVGIVGENGSGKSTLVSILGLIRVADSGYVVRKRPICLIPQTIAPPRERAWRVFAFIRGAGPLVIPRAEKGRLQAYGRRFGVIIDPDDIASSLSPVQAFFLELYGGIDRGDGAFLLDEPAPFLSGAAGDALARAIQHLARAGAAVVVISHKLEAVRLVCDRVVVMERGRIKLEAAAKSIEAGELAQLAYARGEEPVRRSAALPMVPPMALPAMTRPASPALTGADPASRVPAPPIAPVGSGNTAAGAHTITEAGESLSVDVWLIDGTRITFSAKPGAVTAVVQRIGAGAYALEDALVGLSHPFFGEILWRGQNVTRCNTRELRKLGLVYVPGMREVRGLALGATVADNLLAVDVAMGQPIRRGQFAREVASRADRFAFPNRPWVTASTLSGGNHSRLIYARELSRDGDLVLFSRPYIGLDDGAIAAARKFFAALKQRGATVVIFSQDPDEILDLADSLVIPEAGAASRVVSLRGVTIDDVRNLLSGRPDVRST